MAPWVQIKFHPISIATTHILMLSRHKLSIHHLCSPLLRPKPQKFADLPFEDRSFFGDARLSTYIYPIWNCANFALIDTAVLPLFTGVFSNGFPTHLRRTGKWTRVWTPPSATASTLDAFYFWENVRGGAIGPARFSPPFFGLPFGFCFGREITPVGKLALRRCFVLRKLSKRMRSFQKCQKYSEFSFEELRKRAKLTCDF